MVFCQRAIIGVPQVEFVGLSPVTLLERAITEAPSVIAKFISNLKGLLVDIANQFIPVDNASCHTQQNSYSDFRQGTQQAFDGINLEFEMGGLVSATSGSKFHNRAHFNIEDLRLPLELDWCNLAHLGNDLSLQHVDKIETIKLPLWTSVGAVCGCPPARTLCNPHFSP